MRIYLIGLPGCGKTTLGKILAEQINYEFIDMDVYIEQQALMFVDEIFDAYGEAYFRKLESNVLEELSNKENVVIATGGGIVKCASNKENMKGPVVYLSAPLNSIEHRIQNSSIIRPLLQKKSLEDLYLERKEQYISFMDIEVENNELAISISKILDFLGDKI